MSRSLIATAIVLTLTALSTGPAIANHDGLFDVRALEQDKRVTASPVGIVSRSHTAHCVAIATRR